MEEVESEVIIDVDDINEVEKESLVVGRLVSQYWNYSSSNYLIDDITKAWNLKHGISWKEFEFEESKLILFCFNHVTDREWVLKNQPWLLNEESLFAIKKFTRGDEEYSVNVTSFWARLYDAPCSFSCMNETTLSLFAKQIGILESVDISGEDLIGTFIRFKVSINITEPLVRGISIRVKGEHLWLPLMYESLPIYCFSCGTIGHDYNNCPHNYDHRILKYSNLKWTASSTRKTDHQDTLPHDIVECILSRLPVKYLVRYKLVCKEWKATISDPRFAETHLRQYNNSSSSRNLLAYEDSIPICSSGSIRYSVLKVAQLDETHNLNFVSTIGHSWKCPLRFGNILGSCDGLYLIRCFALHHELKNMCVVWNPSCRAYREIWCPKQIYSCYTLYGIYYNPLMKDYKVVIGDTKHYATFSCRLNKWSEVKETTKDIYWCINISNCGPSYTGVSATVNGASVNGALYWLVFENPFLKKLLICFDWKEEKFKEVVISNVSHRNLFRFQLSSSGASVCLWHRIGPDQIMIMKILDDKGSWEEFNVELQRPSDVIEGPDLLCWVSEEEIILYYANRIGVRFHIIYNLSNNTFASIHTHKLCIGFDYPRPLFETISKEGNNAGSYLENLFLQ